MPEACFIGRCDALEAEDLHAYDDSSRDIQAATFRRIVGPSLYRQLESNLGYTDEDGRPYNRGLSLATDWSVRFTAGKWRGKPAAVCHWSAYHHVYLRSTPTR